MAKNKKGKKKNLKLDVDNNDILEKKKNIYNNKYNDQNDIYIKNIYNNILNLEIAKSMICNNDSIILNQSIEQQLINKVEESNLDKICQGMTKPVVEIDTNKLEDTNSCNTFHGVFIDQKKKK